MLESEGLPCSLLLQVCPFLLQGAAGIRKRIVQLAGDVGNNLAGADQFKYHRLLFCEAFRILGI